MQERVVFRRERGWLTGNTTSEPRLGRSEDMNEWYLYYLWPNCIHILGLGADSNLCVCLNITFLLFFFFHNAIGEYLSSLTKPSFETSAAGRQSYVFCYNISGNFLFQTLHAVLDTFYLNHDPQRQKIINCIPRM